MKVVVYQCTILLHPGEWFRSREDLPKLHYSLSSLLLVRLPLVQLLLQQCLEHLEEREGEREGETEYIIEKKVCEYVSGLRRTVGFMNNCSQST